MKKITKLMCIAFVIVMLALCAVGCGGSSSSSKRSNSSSSEKGFVGSDGKYHAYVPEFGDDVNEWMKENW
jgi:hypothetical protein